MVQLDIVSGKKSGEHSFVRHFPFHIGRVSQNELQLEDDGVWDQHLAIEFQKGNGFNLLASPNARTTVNGEFVQNKILRNGDVITLGSAKLQFWLAAAQQHGLRSREMFVWALLISVTAFQFILLYWLIR